MKLRNFLRIMIPVCALATVSCTNEELILEASQTQRGRDFAQAFKARFDNIDPNHTWIDGTVGKVMVTVDEPANIVIYALGRSDGKAIRLKRCVVEGTQEVRYDIPLGCKDVVIRAYNSQGNIYKSLNPENANDEVVLHVNANTRAASLGELNAMGRTEIPNVWNQYGSIAPWQSNLPNVNGIIAKFDECDHDYARNIASDGDVRWEYYNADLGWNFYFHHNQDWPNKTEGLNYTAPEGYYFNIYSPNKPMGYNYWIPTYLFSSDADFEAKTGLSSGEYAKLHENGGNHANTIPLKPNQEYDDVSLRWGIKYFPAGDYYCFNAFGKRGSWWNHKDSKYGHFYTSNINISSKPGNMTNQGGDYLRNTTIFYNEQLPSSLVNALQEIVVSAESNPDLLKDFNTDAGLYTTAPGPVSVQWFYSETTTRDYVGYYYVKHINGESKESFRERCDAAPKYLLLEATCTDNRTQGDVFPLTFYGENGTGAATFEFPAGYDIQFFVLHGRDSSTNNINPHSGQKTWTANGVNYKGNYNGDRWVDDPGYWTNMWKTSDPVDSYGINAVIRPERVNSQYSWLFYDADRSDNINSNENGWTLNPYYCCFSHGGDINTPAVKRIGELEFGWPVHYHDEDTYYGVIDHRIEEWYDGDYKPMVAFRYMGVNIVGFEDTPIEQYNGLDWNDCVFIIKGNFNIPEINEGDLAFSMCMEDLGDTDDLDYNDLYMVVLQGWEEIVDDANHVNSYEIQRRVPRLILDMAGGILPLKINYEDEERNISTTLVEDVHTAFGSAYATKGDRVAINTVNPQPDHGENMVVSADGSFENGNIATVTFKDGAIVKCTRGLGNRVISFDENVFTSDVLRTFSIIDNIPNFKIYVKYNENTSNEETVLINGPTGSDGGNHNTVNIGYNTDKIPYAIWFPSTASSESVESQNQELNNSRVHPGYERQYIGNYLDEFDEWVADQNHTGRRWYDWEWGSNKNWSENKPEDPSQGGTGTEVTHDYYKTYTNHWGYNDEFETIYIGAEEFRNTNDDTKETVPNRIIIKINFGDTGQHVFKLMSRDTAGEDLELLDINESGRSTVTKILDPNQLMNGLTAQQAQYFIDQIAGTGDGQGRGLAILWPKTETTPNSFQIHCEYANK